jgi:hypothetical protein
MNYNGKMCVLLALVAAVNDAIMPPKHRHILGRPSLKICFWFLPRGVPVPYIGIWVSTKLSSGL